MARTLSRTRCALQEGNMDQRLILIIRMRATYPMIPAGSTVERRLHLEENAGSLGSWSCAAG